MEGICKSLTQDILLIYILIQYETASQWTCQLPKFNCTKSFFLSCFPKKLCVKWGEGGLGTIRGCKSWGENREWREENEYKL